MECNEQNDNQIVEFGVINDENEETNIEPIDIKLWEERTTRRRNEQLKISKIEVNRVVQEVNDSLERKGG